MKFLFLFPFFTILLSCKAQNQSVRQALKKDSDPATEQSNRPKAQVAAKNPRRILVTVEYLNASYVRSQTNGVIEKLMRESASFEKGELLVQLDNREAFDKLVADKEKLISTVGIYRSTLKNTEEDKTWLNFEAELSPYKLLPEIPHFSSPAWEEQELLRQYNSIKSQEENMKNFFLLSKQKGIVLEQKFKVGQKVKSGQVLLITGKNKRKHIKLPEHFSYRGKANLHGTRTTEIHQLSIAGKLIEVPSTLQTGEYYLELLNHQNP